MKSVKKAMAVLAALIMAVTVLAGCGGNKTAETQTTGPKVLKLYLSNGTSLDPHIWTWGSHWDRMGIFEGLTKMDNNFKAIPANAEKWEHNADYTVWTFHLRKDLKWSDGTALTAKDYEYSMKRVIDPNSLKGQSNAFNSGVPILKAKEVKLGQAKQADLGIKATDDYTLQITLDTPSATLDVSVAENWALPVPKHIIDKLSTDWCKVENIVCNGPYKPKEWQQNAKLTLVKNDKYYGKANFDEIDVLSGTGNQLLAYKNGDINIANLGQADMQAVNADATLSKQVGIYKSGVVYFMDLLNSENDILQKNVKVRQAIAMSIDKASIAKDIMFNTVRDGKSLVPEIFASWGNDIGLKYDQAKAKQLMSEAGFPDGKGFPEMTILLAGTPTGRELAYKDMIEKGTGIKVKLVNEEWAVFTKDIAKLWPKDTIGWYISGTGTSVASYTGYFNNGQWDLGTRELNADIMKQRQVLKDDAKMDAGVKTGKINDLVAANLSEAGKQYKDLLDKAGKEIDPAKKEALFKQAGQLRENEACTIALDWENGVKLVKPELKGYVGNAMLLGTPPLYFDSISMGSAK